MNRKLVSFMEIALFVLLMVGCLATFQIKHGRIYDDKNRQIFFHGMNIAVKVAPYLPKTDAYDKDWSFSKEDINNLTQSGFNAIRLGIMWSGLEPTKDQFNDTYLQELVKIVNTAGGAGIYTLLEFHQKVLSESFCGVGLPPWLIHEDNRYKTFPYPIERQKYPVSDKWIPDKLHCQRHNTSVYFYSYDCAQGFNELYDEDSYLYQKFVKAWQKVAQAFKGNKYVIAYDLLNQPWVGNQIRNPFLLIPGVAQRAKLQKFYDRVSENIRQIDADATIVFQTSIVAKHVGASFYHPPGGDRYRDKSILGYSYGKQNEKSLYYKYQDAKRLGVPSFISQMYSSQRPMDKSEFFYQSWFYFYFKSFGSCCKANNDFQNDEEFDQENKDIELNDDQSESLIPQELELQNQRLSLLNPIHNSPKTPELQGGICPQLIRTYLQRVAGCLAYSGFDKKTGRFVAAYQAEPNGETILYLNKEYTYGNKYSIQAAPKDQIEIVESKEQATKNYVTLKFTGKERTEVVVNVIKKAE